MRAAWILMCIGGGFLAGCTAPHSPARDGVWIVNSTPLVRCEQTAEGVVCKSIRTIPADDIGI